MPERQPRTLGKSSIPIIEIAIIRLIIIIRYINILPPVLIDVRNGNAQSEGQRILTDAGFFTDIGEMSPLVFVELISRQLIRLRTILSQFHIVDLFHIM